MNKSCRKCIYFNQKENDDGWYSIRQLYECQYHKLSNGELSHPDSQVCEDWLDIKVKLRNNKIDKILKCVV